MDYEPPFLETYKTLLEESPVHGDARNDDKFSMVERCEIPLIDVGRLKDEICKKQITEAARRWGFFQVVNHGIPQPLLDSLVLEQMIKLFHRPFAVKSQEKFNNSLPSSGYRWGNPSATTQKQLSWSEAYHLFLPDMERIGHLSNLRSTVERFATRAAWLGERVGEILGEEVSMKWSYFRDKCLPKSGIVRLNRYPACPFPSRVFGIVPHTDSSFLSFVYQDQVGGLQLLTDGHWLPLKPNPQALLVIIGDLFQAVSNGAYKSIKHRVVSAEKVERYSVAYFYSPSCDAVIEGNASSSPSLYRKFTFGEYKEQTDKDVKETGDKVGLPRFLVSRNFQHHLNPNQQIM